MPGRRLRSKARVGNPDRAGRTGRGSDRSFDGFAVAWAGFRAITAPRAANGEAPTMRGPRSRIARAELRLLFPRAGAVPSRAGMVTDPRRGRRSLYPAGEMKHLFSRLFVLAGLLLAGCAQGGNCSVEKWAELPLQLYRNVPLVPVLVNRKPALLVLDTGAQRTLITRTAAARLGIERGQKAAIMRGIGGATVNWETKPESFSFAAIGVDALSVMVAPITLPTIEGVEPEGLLGADVLAALDVEIDIPHRRIAFYRQRTCVAGPPWAEPYATIR